MGFHGILLSSETIHCLLEIRDLLIAGAIEMQKVEAMMFGLFYYMRFLIINAVSTRSLP